MHVHVRFFIYEPKVVLRLKGVVQIHHGIGEHASLYDHFASYLSNQGFVVVVSDFAGHGKSLIDFEQGYFGEHNGPEHLIQDMHHLQKLMRQRYSDIPYFMLGVDLGSVMIRKYASTYGDFIDGMILLGTPVKVTHRYMKKTYLSFMRMLHGPMFKSQSYFRSFHHSLNKKIKQVKGEVSWLTTDENELKSFLNDPMTNFSYTVQGYKDIVDTIHEVNSEHSILSLPSHLAVYIGVGEFDPLCVGISKLVEKYKKKPINDLTYQIFAGCRHALLFEKEKEKIYKDILCWLNERTYL